MVFMVLAGRSDYFLMVVIFAALSFGKSKMVMPELLNPHQIKYRYFPILEVGFLHSLQESELLAEYRRKDVIKP